jgi:hypothetical protein
MSLCNGSIYLLLLFVEDYHILEVRVRSVEISSIDGAVKWESKGFVIGVLVARPNTAVAKGLVIVGLEVLFILLDVGCQDDVEGVGLASLLASRKQQALRVATVAFTLQRGTRIVQQDFGRSRPEQAGYKMGLRVNNISQEH